MVGSIARILKDKNFGFIHNDGKEYFFHRDSVTGDWKHLSIGMKVEFDDTEGAKGLRAEKVRLI